MNIELRRLGQSALSISPVGIGTAPIGSTPDWAIYWGPQSEDEARQTITTALEKGVNWIDTAPFYGWGRAEEIVGRSLGSSRHRILIFTKCGTVQTAAGGSAEDLHPQSIRHQVEASLRRLQTDYIDLLQFHDPDPNVPIEESWGTLHELIKEGKVRYGGLSNHSVALMRRAQRVGPIIAIQHQYNLLEQEIEADVLPFAAQNNIGVLCWSPLLSGFLTDNFDLGGLDPADFRRTHRYAREPGATRLIKVIETLKAVAEGYGKTMTATAVAWVLGHQAVTAAIIGIRTPDEAQTIWDGVGWQVSEADRIALGEALG